MKKVPFCFSLLSLVILLANYGRANAAACDTSSAGSVTIAVPALPSTGTYNIWSRVQVPDDSLNRYLIQVNGNTCFLVGGASLTPGQWKWVSFQDGNLSSKVSYNFTKVSSNSLQLIGADAGVKVDRVLLIKTDCIPIDLGNNCQTNNATSTANFNGALVVPPLTRGPVSGVIIPSPTIIQNQSVIAKVLYYVDSKQIPTATNFGIDTTLLSNGSHQLSMQITKIDGTQTNESTILTTDNMQTTFSPIFRWARLNIHALVVSSTILGILLSVTALSLIIRHLKLQKRLLKFHGF